MPESREEGYSRSRPPQPGGDRGWGFLGGCGRAVEAGLGRGGASWGLWAAGVAWDTQERRPPRREQRRSPDGAPLHGAGSLRAVATRQPSDFPRSPASSLSCSLGVPSGRRRPLVPGTGVPGASHGAVQPLPSPPAAGAAVAGLSTASAWAGKRSPNAWVIESGRLIVLHVPRYRGQRIPRDGGMLLGSENGIWGSQGSRQEGRTPGSLGARMEICFSK